MKFRFSDILIFALLFIFVAAFPVDLFKIEPIYEYVIRISLLALILIYYIYVCYINHINIFKFYNLKRMLLFAPFLLVCFSNLIATGIDGSYGVTSISSELFAVMIIYHFLQAISEEFLFRLFIQGSLIRVGSIKRILYGALIFALFHLLNMVSIRTVDQLVTVLIQVAYSFGLGILLGFVYEYTYSLPACIFLHFAFNFFNTVLFEYLGCKYNGYFVFYMTAVVIALVLAIYTFLIYWFVLRRNDRYFRE